jgi:replication factor C subunit 2/4
MTSQAESSRGARPTTRPGGAELPWVEKYRPQYLSEIVGNAETIERLQVMARDGNMPHLLVSGMPGVGKTSSVVSLARELLAGAGPKWREALLELNASDERGIDVVRGKIKTFAQKKVTLPEGRHKIVILDEADRYCHLSEGWRRLTTAA